MSEDYPDWTDSIQIIGTDIMIPFDLQGANIMVPMDIQGQNIDLAIDIVAQTIGNIAIDLVAQSVGNIEVDIKAQTIGNLVIDIEAQSVGVYLQPDWSALQGTDKNFNALSSDLATGLYTSVEYDVPGAKTLYITHIAGWSTGYLHSDRDKNQMMAVAIYDEDAGDYLFFKGGNGGAGMDMSKPVVIPGGHNAWFMCFNFANHNCDLRVSAGGYEL